MRSNSDELHHDRTHLAERQRGLQRAFGGLRSGRQEFGAVERIVADYCRERHREGAEPTTVIIELKRAAHAVLGEEHTQFDHIVSACIRNYYGDIEVTFNGE